MISRREILRKGALTSSLFVMGGIAATGTATAWSTIQCGETITGYLDSSEGGQHPIIGDLGPYDDYSVLLTERSQLTIEVTAADVDPHIWLSRLEFANGVVTGTVIDTSSDVTQATLLITLDPGTYLVTVTSVPGTQTGDYSLSLTCTPVCDGEGTRLLAGQDIDVGSVTVEQSAPGEPLLVRYRTIGDWYMTETHVHVAADCDDVPQNKAGNPKIGHFEFSDTHDPAVQEHLVEVPLDSAWASGDSLCIAAHATVFEDTNDNGTFESEVDCEETAWGEGDPFAERGNWAMAFEYEVC